MNCGVVLDELPNRESEVDVDVATNQPWFHKVLLVTAALHMPSVLQTRIHIFSRIESEHRADAIRASADCVQRAAALRS